MVSVPIAVAQLNPESASVSLTPKTSQVDTDVNFILHITSDTAVGYIAFHVPRNLETNVAYYVLDLQTLALPDNWQYSIPSGEGVGLDANGNPVDLEFKAKSNNDKLTDITITFTAHTTTEAGTYTWEITLCRGIDGSDFMGTWTINTTITALSTQTKTPVIKIYTPEQKEAINYAKDVCEKIDETRTVNMEEVKAAMRKLVENRLMDEPTFSFSKKIAQKLRVQLQQLYGENLEKFPTPEGRIWLLYMLWER